MNTEAIEKALIEIIKKRSELNQLSYEDEKYDETEDALHDLEDDFVDDHGDTLEDILSDVHDDLCPDIDVLSPLSYIAQQYVQTGENAMGPEYDVTFDQGVFVEVDDYLGKPTKLVIIPNPLRIILNIDRQNRELVWSKETKKQ
ncbi:hypothetical protein V6R21_18015 [Limibacter armeniacum]|uniref:hypothetical protein n=1 Tax=Limibacter armeniacum TaxID=466084 RepID=UPI002FE66ABF